MYLGGQCKTCHQQAAVMQGMFKARPKTHSQFISHHGTKMFVLVSTFLKVSGSRGRSEERLEVLGTDSRGTEAVLSLRR